MKSSGAVPALLFGAVTLLAASTVLNFDTEHVGAEPAGFSQALTGQGRPGKWLVVRDDGSPDRKNVLGQTDDDPTSYRFPLCIYDGLELRDVDVSVRFKPVRGTRDQGAGIVWRYRDKDNYYLVRANALEGNVVLYKVQNGKRSDLPLRGAGRTYGKKDFIPSGQWGMLRVVAQDRVFEVYHDGHKLFDVEDDTFRDPGKVGVWTKADSVIYFDDLEIEGR
jgi:hypothetical protein